MFVCRSRNSVLSSENSPHSEDILCPIYFTPVCVCVIISSCCFFPCLSVLVSLYGLQAAMCGQMSGLPCL